jgi:hypothetical protein
VQLDSLRRGFAALLARLALPAARLAGHFEHQPNEKTDPFGINLTAFRAVVQRTMEGEDMALSNDDLAKIWTVLMEGTVPDGYLRHQPGVADESRKQIDQFGATTFNTLNAKLDKILLGVAGLDDFDPQEFAREVGHEIAQALADDPANPLTVEHVDIVAERVADRVAARFSQALAGEVSSSLEDK